MRRECVNSLSLRFSKVCGKRRRKDSFIVLSFPRQIPCRAGGGAGSISQTFDIEYESADWELVVRIKSATKVDDFPLPPWDYNVAPQTMQPIVRANSDTGERKLVQLQMGPSPVQFSTKSPADLKGKSSINARAETITRGWWAQPFRKRRCLVPASDFYE